ncbi:hypothetical protein ABIE33_007287, partial [Ensifer sp. 4252]
QCRDASRHWRRRRQLGNFRCPFLRNIHRPMTTARVADEEVAQAQAILQRSNWVDLEQRRASYAEQGWSGFDETLDPTARHRSKERARYAGRGTLI